MAFYPALFSRTAEDEIVVSFRDLPECLTSGVDETEATEEARDALEEAIIGRIIDGGEIPLPTLPRAGERYVFAPVIHTGMFSTVWRRLDQDIEANLASHGPPASPPWQSPPPGASTTLHLAWQAITRGVNQRKGQPGPSSPQ